MSCDCKEDSTRRVPWGALLAGAALGAVAVALARHWHGTVHMPQASLDEALALCDRAADLLDTRLAQMAQSVGAIA